MVSPTYSARRSEWMNEVGRRLTAMGQSTAAARRPYVVPALAHCGEQHDLADRAGPGEQHHEPVDADPDAAGRRHAVLQRLDVGLVVGLRLLVAGLGERPLLLEPRALVVGVVELGERVRELHAGGVGLPALDQPVL